MQKATQLIAFFLLSLLSISANTARVFKAESGFRAPQFEVTNDFGTVSLSQYEGEYVLVNFWTSADAASRMAAADYDRYFRDNTNRKIRFMSVNLDRSATLFSQVVKADSLNASMQYHVESSSADGLIRDYALSGAMTSFLVDPQGRIIATDPTAEMLDGLK